MGVNLIFFSSLQSQANLVVLSFAQHALNEHDNIFAKIVSIAQILILKLRSRYRSPLPLFGNLRSTKAIEARTPLNNGL